MQEINRTDLALEMLEDEECTKNEGVQISREFLAGGQIEQSIIKIINKKGEKRLGKPRGNYITLESRKLSEADESIHEPFVEALNKQLKSLIGDAKRIFVIGLGNRDVTPDSLGPLVVDNLFITRHLLKEGIISDRLEMSAISPGVMAQTGIESLTILKALCKEVNPDVVLAIDSLAAMEFSRLNTTIQLCDTGIHPGAGVGNNRMKLSEETLGIKVIAIGVPTVISMTNIINQYINEKLRENLMDMFVTPKNIDESVRKVSYTISEAINRLLI